MYVQDGDVVGLDVNGEVEIRVFQVDWSGMLVAGLVEL